MTPAPPLVIHLCSLDEGQSSWSATVAIEASLEYAGLQIAFFYQGQRLETTYLDEWGYALLELGNLSAPHRIGDEVYFEVRTVSPPSITRSISFHPPLVHDSIKTHLEQYKTWPKHLPLRGAQLQGVYLGGADLQGIDLRGADLTGAKLWRSNLKGATLKEAILKEVDLSEANLKKVDLEGAHIHGATLDGADFEGADFRKVRGLTLSDLKRIAEVVTLDERQKRALTLKIENQSINSKPSSEQNKKVDSEPQSPTTRNTTHKTSATYYQGLKDSQRSRPLTMHEKKKIDLERLLTPKTPAKNLSQEDKERLSARQKRKANHYAKYTQHRILRGGVEFYLNFIAEGEFKMGRDQGENSMRPRHPVKISRPFFIGVTLVTQELYQKVMGATRFKFSGAQNPAESVSWLDAIDFCNRLSRIEGLEPAYQNHNVSGLVWNQASNGYRLPTEAEWEYSASTQIPYRFSGSDDVEQVGWYQGNSEKETKPVQQKAPNAWGLYDMSGNVWEWCFDLFSEDAYHKRGEELTIDPVVEGPEGPRVIKGGSWSYEMEGLEVSYRSRLANHFKTSRIGFRIARTPKLQSS